METILKIEETTFKPNPNSWTNYDGWKITTDKQEILIGIGNSQNCCEQWGYVISEDNVEDFIESQLNDIKVVDEELKQYPDLPTYECSCMFINLYTSKGVLQFVTYNSHNGYYGHSAVLISNQVTETTTL